jgi:hypothetical protein
MKRKGIIPINRIGSFYNFPNWRYQIYLNPGKANLIWCCRKPADGANALRRYASYPGVKDNVEVNFSFPSRFQNIINNLSWKNRETFYKLFNSKLKKGGDKKIFCRTYEGKNPVWNIKYVDSISDVFLKKLLYHVSNIKFDHYIQFAVGLKMSPEHEHIFRSLGYHIFAGVSDNEIAKRFKMYPKQIEAIRNLFFDFTSAPKEPTAQAAYFTQLVDNDIISDLDKRYYKLISELGEVGLKAQANYHTLDEEQKRKVENYLGDSMLENVLNLNFAVTDMKDAISFNGVINNLASFYIKKEEVNYYRAKVRNLDASTVRIVNDNSQESGMIDSADQEALKLIGTLALKENSLPEYKPITELNSF